MELDPEARAILAPYVHDGRVDYAALAKNRDLDDLIARIGAYDPAADSRDEQLAFYLNAYNLLTINTVLQRLRRNPQWPGAVSPGAKLRFFLLRRHRVAGKVMSLLTLENGVIRRRFGDPRIHFALNCASRSCPPLPVSLFIGAEVDADLERLTSEFINSSEVRYDAATNTLSASRIFKWYRKDFGPSVVGFIAQYRDVPADASVAFHHYDWRLNSL